MPEQKLSEGKGYSLALQMTEMLKSFSNAKEVFRAADDARATIGSMKKNIVELSVNIRELTSKKEQAIVDLKEAEVEGKARMEKIQEDASTAYLKAKKERQKVLDQISTLKKEHMKAMEDKGKEYRGLIEAKQKQVAVADMRLGQINKEINDVENLFIGRKHG